MESVASPRRTFPGKSFTIAFTILLLFGLVLGFLLVLRFQAIMDSLESVRLLWPNAAVALEEYYSKVDESIEKSADKELLDKWQAARTDYLATSRFDSQSQWVDELHTLGRQSKVQSQIPIEDPRLVKFIESDKKLSSLQSDFIGSVTMLLLRLKIPPSIYQLF